MKKFQFSLNTVLNYKMQVLDNLINEQAMILKYLADAQKRLDQLQQKFKDYSVEFEEKKSKGIAINMIKMYEMYFYNLQTKIISEQNNIVKLEERKEKKRQEVVEARSETKSLEKLKERKFEQYEKELQKSEELFIEEFVSNVRATAKQG